MKKLSSILAAAALAGVVVLPMQSANAQWGGGPWGNNGYGGGPWSTMTDMFGGGDINFSAKSYGHGNGYGYGNPNMGYNSYGYPGYGYGYPGAYGGYPGYGYGYPAAPPAPVAPAAK